MVFKICKVLFFFGLVCFILAILSWYGVRYISTQKATEKANTLLAELDNGTNEEEQIIAITKLVFDNWVEKDPSTIPLYKVRAYITNKRLPASFRLADGVMETNLQTGLCDNAARMLAFLLEKTGYESVQWNMVTNTSGHSARLVTLSDGRKVFVDPFYGVIAVDEKGHLSDLESAQERVRNGKHLADVLQPLGPQSKTKFYKLLSSMHMASEGSPLTMRSILPLLADSTPLILGTINGKARDVRTDGSNIDITPYWYYMGHKYNREWVRVLEPQEAVDIVMTLVQPAEDGILVASPKPEIDGNTLTWHLNKGDVLTLNDGAAKISLERLNSYIEIDQIKIIPRS